MSPFLTFENAHLPALKSRLSWDDSKVKSIGCSSRGPGFDSQLPQGDSQPPVTLVPGDLNTLFWPPWAAGTRDAKTHLQAKHP